MDNLYAVCLEQISLSGFEGISLPYLWKLLSELSLPCPIDIYTKKWIWEQLKANTDQLQFYLSEEETPSLEYVCRGRDRGFCDSNRKTADAVLLSQPLEKLEALKEKFKIVASYELREAALGITQYGLQCTDVQYKILELLAKSRKRGILGSDLADRVGVGPKDLFFQIKTLQKYGIEITKQKVTVPVEGHTSKKTVQTNLLRLSRFVEEESPHAPEKESDETAETEENEEAERSFMFVPPMKKHIVDFFTRSNTQILKESEVRRYAIQFIGKPKYWQKVKRQLISDGTLRAVLAKVSESEELVPCLQLQSTLERKQPSSMNKNSFVMELPLSYQLYKAIEATGPRGLYMKDLVDMFPILSVKNMRKRIQDLESYGVVFVPEQKGKTMNYRLVVSQHFSTESNVSLSALLEHNKKQRDLVELAHKKHNKRKETKREERNLKTESEHDRESQPATDSAKVHSRKHILTVQRMQRETKLTELLENRRIIAVSEIRSLLGKEGDKNSGTISGKTIHRMLNSLQTKTGAKLCTIRLPSYVGTIKSVSLLLHRDVSPDSTEVQDFVAKLKSREASQSQSSDTATREIIEVDKLSNIEPSIISPTSQLPASTSSSQSPNDFVKLALEYGFIRACMVRARLLHQFLWLWLFDCGGSEENLSSTVDVEDLLYEGDTVPLLSGLPHHSKDQKQSDIEQPLVTSLVGPSRQFGTYPLKDERSDTNQMTATLKTTADVSLVEETDNETKSFDLHRLLSLMDINLYCKIVGVTRQIEKIDEYKQQRIRIRDLPPNVKNTLNIGRHNVRRLWKIVNILIQLGLVKRFVQINNGTSATPTDGESTAACYLLLKTVVLFEKTYTFRSLTTVKEYWVDLQRFVLTSKTPKAKTEAQTSELPPEALSPKNWLSKAAITKEQWTLLKEYEKKVFEEDPHLQFCNTPSFIELCQRTHLPQTVIYYFYSKRFATSRGQKRKQKTTEDGQQVTTETVPELLHQSRPKKKQKTTKPSTLSRYSRRKTHSQRNRALETFISAGISSNATTVSDVTQDPTQQQAAEEEEEIDDQIETTTYKPKRKAHFTSNEDNSLLRQYVTLRVQDLSQATIDWTKIDIPGRSQRECMTRFTYLMKQAPYRRAVQMAIKQLCPRDINIEMLIAESPPVVPDIDKHLVHYDLPNSLEELNKHFKVVDITRQSPSAVSSTSTAVLADHIKTLMMVPDSDYYPEVGHKLLSHYTHEEIMRCFQELRSQGWLVALKDKNQLRSYKLSQKFRMSLGKVFDSHLIKDASDFQKKLADHPMNETTTINLPSPINGGVVYQTLLNALEENIVIEPIIPENIPPRRAAIQGGNEEKEHLKMKNDGRNDEESESDNDEMEELNGDHEHRSRRSRVDAPDIELQLAKVCYPNIFFPDEEPIEKNSKEKPMPSLESDMDEVFHHNVTWADFVHQRRHLGATDEDIATTETIYHYIQNAKQNGVTNLELQKVFPNKEDIVTQLYTSRLIERVLMYEDYGWVAKDYLDRWCIAPFRVVSLSDNQQHSLQPQRRRGAATKNQKLADNEMISFSSDAKVVFHPWTQLNGEVNTSVLTQLKSSLFNILFHNPGIPQKKVCEKFAAFRPAIVIELLNHLELANVIYSKLVPFSATTNPLVQLNSLSCAQNEVPITHFERCYWPTPDAIRKMTDILSD